MQAGRQRRNDRFRLLLILSFFLALTSPLRLYALDCKAAAIYDVGARRFVFELNSRKRLPPASTIKVLTALFALNTLGANQYITISKEAAGVEPSKAYLRPGEVYKVIDLVYAMLISSANDAAHAISEAIEAKLGIGYADAALDKSREWKLRDTSPLTPHGLPHKGQLATARDMCILMAMAIRNAPIKKALALKTYTFYSRSGRRVSVRNHNKLLRQQEYRNVLGKTGYTKSARHCFLGYVVVSGREYTFVVLGGRTLWKNVRETIEIIKNRQSAAKRK